MYRDVINYVMFILFSYFLWLQGVGGDVLLDQLQKGSNNFQQELTKLTNDNLGYQTLQVILI